MKATECQAAFDAGAQAWAGYNRLPLGRIRCELVWHDMEARLPAATDGNPAPQVLDAGGGSGELAMRPSELGLTVIARCGVRVFADYLPRERLTDPAFYNAVLRLEKRVAECPTYQSLARYSQLIARKPEAAGEKDPPITNPRGCP
jgi:hypothetical protein